MSVKLKDVAYYDTNKGKTGIKKAAKQNKKIGYLLQVTKEKDYSWD